MTTDPMLAYRISALEALFRQIADTRMAGLPIMNAALRVEVVGFELCASEPDLPTAAERLVAAGATHIRVLPLFFGMGKHAREDLPQLMIDLATQHPDVRFEQLAAAGEDPRLTALLARIALENTP